MLLKALDVVDGVIAKHPNVVVVFFSGKPGSFVVGADIHWLYPVTDPRTVLTSLSDIHKLLDRIAALPVTTVSAIHGPALGGGLELALSTRLRIASDAKSTTIGLPEIKLGLLPGAGGTVRLPRLIGLQQALGIILPGGAANAKKAKRLGMVDLVLPGQDRFTGEGRFFGEVRRWAMAKALDKKPRGFKRTVTWTERFMEGTAVGRFIMHRVASQGLDKATKGKYPAPYVALRHTIDSFAMSSRAAKVSEARAFTKLVPTSESKHMISLFFLQDAAKKIPRNLKDATIPRVDRVAVLGAGIMGSGIAQLAAHKKWPVYMRDIKSEFVAGGKARVAELFDKLVQKRKMTPQEAAGRNALVTGGTSMEPVGQCDVVIEAVSEVLKIKQIVLAEAEKVGGPNLIFATNTSAIPITEIASTAKHPENVVGMHFFYPVHRMPLVEIIRGKETSDEAVAAVYAMSLRMGKIPAVCNDGPGFITTRMVAIFCSEATRMLSETGDILGIDKPLFDFGYPMGAFHLTDETGLDIGLHVGPFMRSKLGERFADLPGLDTAVKKKWLGRKAGKGFYMYNSKGRKTGLNPDMVDLIRSLVKSPKRLSRADIIDRCTLIMVNEACFLLDEGVAYTPEDIDLMMVFGLGFPPFRGGLLQHADDLGINVVVRRLRELASKFGPRFTPARRLVDMADAGTKFFPNRPAVPYVERKGRPRL